MTFPLPYQSRYRLKQRHPIAQYFRLQPFQFVTWQSSSATALRLEEAISGRTNPFQHKNGLWILNVFPEAAHKRMRIVVKNTDTDIYQFRTRQFTGHPRYEITGYIEPMEDGKAIVTGVVKIQSLLSMKPLTAVAIIIGILALVGAIYGLAYFVGGLGVFGLIHYLMLEQRKEQAQLIKRIITGRKIVK